MSPNLWLGLSINAPFALSVSTPETWAGRNYSGDSSIRSYNATPSIAYRINDWISIGAGVQIQYMNVNFHQGLPTLPGPGPYPQRSWLRIRRHSRRYLNADADDVDWPWLSFADRSEHPWDDAAACGTRLLTFLSRHQVRLKRRSSFPISFRSASASRWPAVDGYGYRGMGQLESDRHESPLIN